MNAVIYLDVTDWQIGQDVTVYFPDTMVKHCKCELLKEQEAVKPTLIREGWNKNYNNYVCPRCDDDVFYEQNYCSECGVRFLWEGR